MEPQQTFFISRAGEDRAMAAQIVAVLQAEGHATIEQDADFGHEAFLNGMDKALREGMRVVALISREYMEKDHCRAEWMQTIYGDPLNSRQRLIPLKVTETEPDGLLRLYPYHDLWAARGDEALTRALILAAVSGKGGSDANTGAYWRRGRALVHDKIGATAHFTGREGPMAAIADTFALGGTVGAAADATRVAAVSGLGGVGKSTLVREYAWRARADYSVVWWFDASNLASLAEGFVALGAQFVRGFETMFDGDRLRLARAGLDLLEGFAARPALLVCDNLEDGDLLKSWQPKRGAHVLISTRQRELGEAAGDVARVPLDMFSRAESLAYLAGALRADRPDVDAADHDAIAAGCGDLPLAMAHVAAILRRNRALPFAALRAELAEH
jgi:hypothetical protein